MKSNIIIPISNEIVWDTEITKNAFILCCRELLSDKIVRHRFDITSFRDDRVKLINYLSHNPRKLVMTGFNNIGFDYPLLHVLLYSLREDFNMSIERILERLNNKVTDLLNPFKSYQNIIKIPAIKQRDLFKIHHFDNKAKITSLKGLEFVMRMTNIQELPFEPGVELDEEHIEIVASYCDNDVDATYVLRTEYSNEHIQLRNKLSKLYKIDMTNMNDVKIGESIFIHKIIQKGGKDLIYYPDGKIKNTHRDKIVISDIILSFINFKTPGFSALLNYLKNKILYYEPNKPILNGAFSRLDPNEIETYLKTFYKKELRKELIDKKNKIYNEYQETLNIVYHDKIYYYGAGGIHMSIEPGVYIPAEDELIIDLDVSGMYPSESIEFKFEPEHLKGYYSEVHKEIKAERKLYLKKTVENQALKLSGNGSYGKGNSKYSPLCDSQYVVQTCINGQLLLTMLIERITEEVDFTNFLQANTDGFTLLIKKTSLEKVMSIVKRWEKLTGLEMEYNYYKKIVINNVNNYIAVFDNDKIKYKGLFVFENLELHKNYSMLVVPKALKAYFVDNIPVRDFITTHSDYYDFFKRTKLQRSHKLVGRTNFRIKETKDYTGSKRGKIIKTPDWNTEIEYQRLSRYYIAKNGLSLFKIMPPLEGDLKIRNNAIEAGQVCIIVNEIQENTFEEMKINLNYDYYINEVNKIIYNLENHIKNDTE